MNVYREEAQQDGRLEKLIDSRGLTIMARLATVGLLGLAILFALHEAAALVAPMAGAVVAGVVLSRIIDKAQARGVPAFVVATAFVLAMGACIALVASAISSRMASFTDQMSVIASRLSQMASHILAPLQALKAQMAGAAAVNQSPAAPSFDMAAVTGMLGGLTPALGGVLIFLATLFFFVAGKSDLRRKIVMAYGRRDSRLSALRILNGVEDALALYFGSATMVYGALGLATALACWAADLGPPALWGVFVFVACFIPFLGVVLVTAALLVAGLSTFSGVAAGVAPAMIYFLAHLVLENAVIPAIVGRRFEVNPFLVFLSIVFWTWMWGGVGAVIASPTLLIVKIIIEELRKPTAPELPT